MFDLLPLICIVFKQPIKTAPRTNFSRVARFVKPCAVRNEDSRYEIVLGIGGMEDARAYCEVVIGRFFLFILNANFVRSHALYFTRV